MQEKYPPSEVQVVMTEVNKRYVKSYGGTRPAHTLAIYAYGAVTILFDNEDPLENAQLYSLGDEIFPGIFLIEGLTSNERDIRGVRIDSEVSSSLSFVLCLEYGQESYSRYVQEHNRKRRVFPVEILWEYVIRFYAYGQTEEMEACYFEIQDFLKEKIQGAFIYIPLDENPYVPTVH